MTRLQVRRLNQRQSLVGAVLLLGGMAAAVGGHAGCGGEGGSGWGQGNKEKNENSAVTNESVFNRRPGAGSRNLGMAYQDGFDNGRKSATDFNMNWMLHWDKDAEWRTEYDRGWKDGRNLRRMQDERAKATGVNAQPKKDE